VLLLLGGWQLDLGVAVGDHPDRGPDVGRRAAVARAVRRSVTPGPGRPGCYAGAAARAGTIVLWDSLEAFRERLRTADALGYELIGVGDSPAVYHELYVSLAVAATETSRGRVGPVVTNPLSRHPLITATAIAAVDDLSAGRAFVGIGTGESAAQAIWTSPSPRCPRCSPPPRFRCRAPTACPGTAISTSNTPPGPDRSSSKARQGPTR
jgi:hypothetical protein